MNPRSPREKSSGTPSPVLTRGVYVHIRTMGRAWETWNRWGRTCTFPDGGAGCPLFVFQSDLLECHKVVCELAFAFVDSGIDVFLVLASFFHDPSDVGNLISGSSAFSKTSVKALERRAAERRYPMSKVRSSGCALLEQW